jgi:2-methylcitrate dehydratase PrpD
MNDITSGEGIIGPLSSYIEACGEAELPAVVREKAKHHILDTLGAIVSGSRLKPGRLAIDYTRTQGGVEEAQVAATQIVTTATNAAFANGIMAHADETDDAHPKSRTHPGCAIVPAALAMAEKEGATGTRFLNAVVAGYDICGRITPALGGPDHIRGKSHCTFGIGGTFGAATAAAVIAGLDAARVRYVISYAAHQALSRGYWMRDEEHIEKAFVFGGLPARSGVNAAVLMQSGFTGLEDPFTGELNFFEAFAPGIKPRLLIEGLGERYEIMFATMKKFPVGLPIQAPLEGLISLIRKHAIRAGDVESAAAHVHPPSASIVNDRDMPDICLQHLFAVTLLDGDLTFAAAHSFERMEDPVVIDLRRRVTLIEDRELIPYHSRVKVNLKDGTELTEYVTTVLGRPDNPMTKEMTDKRCDDLMGPVLGRERASRLVDKIWNLEQVGDVRELRFLLSAK